MKKMKFIILTALFLAILVLIGAGCGGSYNTYKNEKWSYQINYPVDWSTQLGQDNEQGAIMGFMSPKKDTEDAFLENVSVVALVKNESEDFDEEVQKGIKTFEDDQTKDLIEHSKTSLAGLSGYKIVYSESTVNGELQYLHYWLEGGDNKIYILMYTAIKDQYADYLKQAQKIIKSFKVF